MSILTIVSLVVFIGYAVFARVNLVSKKQVESPPQVIGETDEVESPPSATSSPQATLKPKSTTDAQIKINVDTKVGNTTPTSEKIIYPGAVDVGSNRYETSTGGDTVYNWYKGELEKRSYNIRNNVRTKANDKFKAVLQGVSGELAIKVTIDQENASAKTVISVE